MRRMQRLAVILLLAQGASAEGGNAAGWRGDGSGTYPHANVPAEWDFDAGTNARWSTEIGKGQSSPVVAGARVFITAEPAALLCLDRASGATVWKLENGYGILPPGTKIPDKPLRTSENCGYATPTPVTDGTRVWACFGTGIVVCASVQGARAWVRYIDDKPVTDYGRSASPVLAGTKLLVSVSSLIALDAATGAALWNAADAKPTYGTPAVARVGALEVAVTPAGDCINLADGAMLAREIASAVYTSPVVREGTVYFAGAPTVAVGLAQRQDGTLQAKKLWENDAVEGELFASALVHENLVYVVSNQGNLYALDARTGAVVWKKELDIPCASGRPGLEAANIYGSPCLAGAVMVLANDAGTALALAPGGEYREIARSFLDQGSGASPVADGGLLLLRGRSKLYCIGAP